MSDASPTTTAATPASNGARPDAPAGLALFDLDHTLLPIDSDYEWGRFLVRIGVLDPDTHARQNQRFYEQYQQGTLDIDEYLAFALQPLACRPRAEVDGWHDRFMDEVVRPAIRPEAHALVEAHRQAGDLCALVTATNAFVTRPIAALFGIEHLIATEVEFGTDGACTGRALGVPSFREGKITRTEQWLASRGTAIEGFGRSWFYSDSMNDLPLLRRVTDPVATNPDARLEAEATAAGWRVLRLFERTA